LCRFPIISFARNSPPHRHILQLVSEQQSEDVHVNCIASLAAIISLTVDGFGVSALPPATITRELASQKLHFLNVTKAFPSLALLACHRAGQAHSIVGAMVSLARQVARDFSLEHGTEMAVLPDGADHPAATA
jgi:DNA-binding transcriptional LysR family regulator